MGDMTTTPATEAVRIIVDELAEQLGRSVVVNDPLVRQIYGSRHFDDADRVRIRAVLQHDAGSEAVQHVLAHDVARWTAPGRIAGVPELEMAARWCAPLRAGGAFHGTVMVIDAHDDLTADDRAAIAEAATVIATHLSADALATGAARGERDAVLLGLLADDAAARAAAATRLRELNLPDRPHLVVTVVEVAGPDRTSAEVELALRAAQATIENSTRVPGTGAVRGRHADFLQHWIGAPEPDAVRSQADRLRQGVQRTLGPGAGCVVGVGDAMASADDVRLAHRQATVALRAARTLPRLGGIALWSELGEYAPLLSVAGDAPAGSPGARALAALRAHDSGARLLDTLRVYLDEAGNAPRAAKRLSLHRTSLYYRLGQIQDLAGVDLDSGADRLMLHLQLRLDEIGGARPLDGP